MTGPELMDLAHRLKANPYFLAYALATGAASIEDAQKRDGGNHEYVIWNEQRWIEQADADCVKRHYVSIAPGAIDRHCDLLASFIPATCRIIGDKATFIPVVPWRCSHPACEVRPDKTCVKPDCKGAATSA